MSWLRTYMGEDFDPLHPDPEKIRIEDIAHALSNICRYTGHVNRFYSVAQHSVLVSKILRDDGQSREVQLQGLLHDATEGYLNDVVRPLKVLPMMDGYRAAEDNLERVIAGKWGFDILTPSDVKIADSRCLATEARDLMGDPQNWGLPHPPLPWHILAVGPVAAKRLFMNRYNTLMNRTRRTS